MSNRRAAIVPAAREWWWRRRHKENPRLTNDDDEIIQQRIAYVSFACAVSVGLVYGLLDAVGALDAIVRVGSRLGRRRRRPGNTLTDVLRPSMPVRRAPRCRQPLLEWLGIRWTGLAVAALLPLSQLVVLFTGPLLMAYFDQDLPLQRNFRMDDLRDAFMSLQGLRNHVVVRARTTLSRTRVLPAPDAPAPPAVHASATEETGPARGRAGVSRVVLHAHDSCRLWAPRHRIDVPALLWPRYGACGAHA